MVGFDCFLWRFFGFQRYLKRFRLLVGPQSISHDATVVILVFHNNETAVMLVYHANPVGFELFSYVNISICFNKFVYVLAM